jgi:nitrogen fixation/metabolism regulation signal transduction histidine kinase
MALFFAWMGILASALTVYCILLWRKNRTGSRFKAKLTILFLLFVLVPAIPLTLFLASLVTQSADLLLLPGIGEALESSLATIRLQLEEKGRQFISTYPDVEAWSPALLTKEGLSNAIVFRMQGDSLIVLDSVRIPECKLPDGWKPPHEQTVVTDSANFASDLRESADGHYIAVFRRLPSFRVIAVCYPVPAHIFQSKEKISRALDVYNTLSLLKESIIRKNMVWAFAVLFILGLAVLSIQVSKRLSRGISEPIEHLVRGMHRIAAGDFNVSVRTGAKDEFRFLVDSFNGMAVDLKQTRENLLRAERVAAWQEVAKRISHEMKNSLTPATLTLRRLRRQMESGSGGSEAQELMKTVEEEMDSLRRMSAEFAEFSRLPQPEKSSVRLNDIVQSAVRMAESSYGGVTFQTDLSRDLPVIEADPEQIKRVIHNLLKNSVEASNRDSVVRVCTRLQDSPKNAVLLEIEDRGEGMNAELLDKLFTPYFTTKSHGTGLGLAIAEKIIKDHNGEITVESEVGKGTRFTVSFPA